ncbi:MAG: phosphoribosylformylglycinamidine synthase subunit PurS [Candidatus Auribacterota bacterium]|jgi:phosphoribosylformylglycinamidine synthase|uniref:Phosphoribosylformylglycinamidine synthase subunit PurS n=1 Tax=Candidatus Auribacter fodinae TaxID=2093366 RepID=A0A3A4QWS6_9BACT|nr:MAG: phosphoribosylformylglycinamidine synthase subunit PurS [Candidatus Auribacter fodinae]
MDFKVTIVVTLKPSVLDPQGTTVTEALHHMGYNNVSDVRMGKFMEVSVQASSEKAAEQQAHEICKKLLVNPVIETYRLTIKPAQEAAV